MVVALGATLFVGTIPVMVDHEFVALVATQNIDVADIAHIVVAPAAVVTSPHAPSAAATVAHVPSPG